MWHDAGMSSAAGSGFVGRERELARIAAALERAAVGRPARIIVAGPGGIGASRLLDETIRRVALVREPFTVLRGRGWAGRSGEPFAPLGEALGPYLAGLADAELAAVVGAAAEPLLRIEPDLRERCARLGLLPERPLELAPKRTLTWIAEGVLGILERAGSRSPVLLALEDLHLADAGTRAIAVFLTRVSRPARFCLLTSHATDELARGHPLLDDLAAMLEATEPPERIELGPLGRDELANLVAAIEGARPTAAVLLLVSERSGGSPLLAEQVLAARRELSGVALGSAIEDLVSARLAARTPECRRVLRLLAPAGLPLSPELLVAVAAEYERSAAGLPPRSASGPRRGSGALDADLRAGLDEAIAHGFVRVWPDGELAVRNELIAGAIVADLLPGQRRRHHAALGAALAELPWSALRAWHAAHEPDRVREAALRAAESAMARGSALDALAALELAIELGAADGRDRAAGLDPGELLVRAADVSVAAERPARALAYLEAAAARFDEGRGRLALAGIHDRLGWVRRSLGDHEGALAEHRRAVGLATRTEPAERAPLLASFAQALMLDGRFAEAEPVARRAIEVARSAGAASRAWEGHALCTLGIIRAWSAAASEAVPLLEGARDIARELGRADDAFRATANLSTALTLQGRRHDAIAVATTAIAEIRRDGLEAAYGNALRGNVAEALLSSGRWAEARSILGTALEWSPGAEAFADAAISLAALEVESASDDRAARLLGRVLLELRKAPDPQSEVPASLAAASFALWRGDVADADRAADLGWSLVRRSEDWVATARMAATVLEVQAAVVTAARERRDLAAIAAARGRAAEVLREAERLVAASGVGAGAASRGASDAHLAAARAYAARLEGSDRPVVWDALARAWERLGDPYQVARARWRQAEAALAGTDARSGRVIARKPLREAVRIARELGARPLERELTELARRALITLPEAEPVVGAQVATIALERDDGDGARPDIVTAFADAGPARRGDTFGLSSREREVLGLIVEGRTNREIGERLFISQKTVGVHVGNILAKLGASGRVEAAMLAVRLDLVTPRARAGSR